MKLLKSIRMTVALILTLTMIALVPLNTAAANTGKYVSEVYVAYGKDAEEAKKTLEDKGFTSVEDNLNDGSKTYVMMGYKTTDDIRESITDLAVMNMRGDYSVEEYKTLLNKQKTEIAEFLTEFMAVIKEYRANLKAGKAKATYVHDLLNKYIEDEFNQGMGDLLNEETLQDKVGIEESVGIYNDEHLPDLVTILLQGNAQVIKSIETLLSMATDTAENSWVDRFAETDYDDLLDKVEKERPELNTEAKRVQYLDNLYGESANILALESAALKNRLDDYKKSGLDVPSMTEEEVKKTFGDIKNDLKAAKQYQDSLEIASIQKCLSEYEGGRFKKGELGAFFSDSEENSDDNRAYIPMAAALSEGQRNGLLFSGLEQLLNYAFTTDEGWKEFINQYMANYNGLEKVSVYQNIDLGLYKEDGSVALTGSAQRSNNTAEGTTGDKISQMDTLSKITAISWGATAGSLLVTYVSKKITGNIIKNAMMLDPQGGNLGGRIFDAITHSSDDYYQSIVNDVNEGTLDKTILAAVNKGRFACTLFTIVLVTTLAIAVFSAVMTIIDLCRDKSVEQLPIPNYLVNNYTDADGGNYSLNYKAVECNRMEYFGEGYKKQKGDSADLLADEGKQWLVLYASKNSKAGKPLTPDFVVQKSNKAPSGYEGFVHLIGEKGAVNVVSGAFKNYSTFSTVWQSVAGDYSMYIFSKLSNDVKTYDESAGNMTASTLGDGMWAIFGFGGLVIGGALGAVIAIMINKNKKKKETV